MKKFLFFVLAVIMTLCTGLTIGCKVDIGNESCTVKFVIDKAVVEEQKVNKGKAFNEPSISTDKEGYTFDGWQYEDGELVDWDDEQTRKVDGNVTIVAKYTAKKFGVKFFVNGNQVGATQSVEYGKEFTLPADSAGVEKSYMTISGWKLRDGDGTVYTKSTIDKTVKGDAVYDAVLGLKEYNSVRLSGFTTECGLNESYTLGDKAKVVIKFKDGTEYTVGNNEYELIVPKEFGKEEKEYCVVVKIKLGAGIEKPLNVSVTGSKLSVLFIGNSFSDDTIDLSYKIAESAGIKNIEIADLYIGGCTIDRHVQNLQNNSADYIFRHFDENGTLLNENNSTMLYGIQYRRWDYIVLQQGSAVSGVQSSYDKLGTLIDYVKANATNADVKLAFNMTWAYAENSPNGGFTNYGKNQQTMYDAIVSAVKERIVPNEEFSAIIPNGTAVQNARTSFVGDNLTRDQYDHLTLDFGRYVAGLTFVSKITEISVDDIDYAPEGLNQSYVKVAKESVKNALATPFAVTGSAFAEDPIVEKIGNMDQLTLTFGKGYYYSVNKDNPKNVGTETDNKVHFYHTQIFTKSQLPAGSIIYIQKGWRYRPEGWINGASNTEATRPAEVFTSYIEITENWWGSFTERAFNVSLDGWTTDIASRASDIPNVFKIYVPKT